MIILAKLVFAHLLGDFMFQTGKMVEHKEKHKWASGYLYLHIAIHLVLMLLLTWQDNFQIPVLIIAAAHYVIDGLKLQFQTKKTQIPLFVLDQILHFTVLAVVWYVFKGHDTVQIPVWTEQTWWVIIGYVFVTLPAAILIMVLMSRWSTEIDMDTSTSLKDAGKYIGILERLFVFTFILINAWGAIGFLLAAKSIFRFGDRTRAKDRKLTEYILIGTFLSFAFAILAGVLVKYLI